MAPDLGPYASYILGAYALAGLVLGWMILGSILANRAAQKRLRALEAREPEHGR